MIIANHGGLANVRDAVINRGQLALTFLNNDTIQ
jgi:hypothetical protein